MQVNNLNLLRGMIGKPGCGILQMNGQPTAQNTRECGCDGEMPGFRNWENLDHIEDLARLWNVDPDVIPHWATPTHAMQIFRYAEAGSIKFLWIIATNPAVSLPDLPRIRKILGKEGLFLVVQDAFLTETAEFADVVLPAAIWGEKTGTFTNADRTVHLSHKAVEPPGEARADLDIFLDYARRMDFRDKDGAPLIKWSDPEGAFEAWKGCSRGRPCDYTGLSYAKLTGGSGIQWPCNERAPRRHRAALHRRPLQDRRRRLRRLRPRPDHRRRDHRAGVPRPRPRRPGDPQAGRVRAAVRAARRRLPVLAHHRPGRLPLPHPDQDRPLEGAATTPRPTPSSRSPRRTPTGSASPTATWSRSSRAGARSAAPARVGDIIAGHLFVPFHYGYWDEDDRPRAANELTLPEWDPVSKQPHFKYAAVRLGKVTLLDRAGDVAGAVAEGVKGVAEVVKQAVSFASAAAGDGQVDDYLGLARSTPRRVLADAFRRVGERHAKRARHAADLQPVRRLVAARTSRPWRR